MIRKISSQASLMISLLTFLLALALVSMPVPTIQGQEKKAADPWSSSETIPPAQLAKMLTDKYVSVPTVLFVGFRSLYAGGHVLSRDCFDGTGPCGIEGMGSLSSAVD